MRIRRINFKDLMPGVEFKGQRCELWTRGIFASKALRDLASVSSGLMIKLY